MATYDVPKTNPPPLAWQDKVRNGKVPDWRVPLHAIKRHHFAAAHMRKLVFAKTTSPMAAPQGQSGTTTPWRWQCRTGENVESGSTIKLYALALVLPADNGAATDPKWRFFAGASNSAYVSIPTIDTSPVFDDIVAQNISITGLAPDTQYQCGLEVLDYGRVLALAVWEVVLDAVDTSATYISTRALYGADLPITDAQHSELVTDAYTLFKHNAGHQFSLVPDTVGTVWTTSSTSYVNMLVSGHSTTVGANTAGLNPQAQYHNAVSSANVACVFAVYGMSTTAAGGDVILKDDNGTTLATLSDFGTSAEWKSTTLNLDGTRDCHKVDVQFRARVGTAMTVYAVSLYEYEA